MSMSSTELLSPSTAPQLSELSDDFEYRALSTGAVAALIFGLLSLSMFITSKDSLESSLMLSPIPLVGLAIGIRAWRTIRQTPDQLSGARLALAGIVLSATSLVGALSHAGYVHATEVPPGYERTSFYEFRPRQSEHGIAVPIPREVLALDGKKVFIKGYMREDSTPVRNNVRRFLLVRDNNECCFGDISNLKYYDQVKVDFKENLTTNYSTRLFRIGGTLRIHPENVARGAEVPVYTMEADYVQ
jgi:hypothetical protein